MKPILFFGEALTDCFYDEHGTLVTSTPGGSPFNTAVGAARLELPAAFCGAIGCDDAADALFKVMREENVDESATVVKLHLPTTKAEVRLNSNGEPSFSFHREHSADASICSADIASVAAENYSCLHCGGVMLTSEPGASAQKRLMERFYSADVPVSFDLNVRPSLIKNDDKYREDALLAMARPQLVKLSREDIEWLFPGRDINDSFADLHCLRRGAMPVLTLGAQGSLLASGQTCIRQLAYSVTVKDTTGCGDGFAAGLLRGLMTLDGCAWDELTEEQLRWVASGASAAAARVCEAQGAIAAMPRLADIYAV